VKLFRKVYHKLLGASDYDRAPENMKRTLTNMLDSDKKLDISKVTTPTSILWGKNDTVTPPRHAEKMQKLLPNSNLQFYGNWTHAPYISDPSGLASRHFESFKEYRLMLFLGQASNFRGFKTWKHFFAVGGKHNSDELRAYIAAHYGTSTGRVALFHNGRSALTVAIRELLPEGGEVVITGLTCIAVVQAVRAAGCEPVYADIDVETLHYGKKELLEVLKNHPDVKAVVVQNNLGNPADIENIEKICKKHKLFLIEDLAHCAGVRYAGWPRGWYGWARRRHVFW